MKYLLSVLLLLLLSCSNDDLSRTEIKTGKIYTEYLQSTINWENRLRGPVKKVVPKIYKVTGDTASYTILMWDSTTTVEKGGVKKFYKNGLVESQCIVGGYMRMNDQFIKESRLQYIYDKRNIVQAIIDSSTNRYVTIGNQKELRRENSVFNGVCKYSKDTVRLVDSASPELVVSEIIVEKKSNKNILSFFRIQDSSLFKTVYLTKEKDGRFYISRVEKSNVLSFSEFEFDEKKLKKQRYFNVRDESDTLITEYVYNEMGDVEYSCELLRVEDEVPANVQRYTYVYDDYGNWTEMVRFHQGRAYEAIRREITYWEE